MPLAGPRSVLTGAAAAPERAREVRDIYPLQLRPVHHREEPANVDRNVAGRQDDPSFRRLSVHR
jgi:hypothetical protein